MDARGSIPSRGNNFSFVHRLTLGPMQPTSYPMRTRELFLSLKVSELEAPSCVEVKNTWEARVSSALRNNLLMRNLVKSLSLTSASAHGAVGRRKHSH
jgi:hypothetical protein